MIICIDYRHVEEEIHPLCYLFIISLLRLWQIINDKRAQYPFIQLLLDCFQVVLCNIMAYKMCKPHILCSYISVSVAYLLSICCVLCEYAFKTVFVSKQTCGQTHC